MALVIQRSTVDLQSSGLALYNPKQTSQCSKACRGVELCKTSTSKFEVTVSHEKYKSSENHVFLKARQAAPRPLSGTATPPQVRFTLFALGTCLNGHDVCFRDLYSNINHRCSNTYNKVILYVLCNYFGEFLSI